MKKYLFALSFLVLGTSAFADAPMSGAQQIYNALRVDAVGQNVPGQVSGTATLTSIKSVGGLNCYETSDGTNISYSCAVSIDKHDADMDAKEIFDKLEGRNVTEGAAIVEGREAVKREVSGLTCVRFRTSMLNRDFKCTLVLR